MTIESAATELLNYVGGEWVRSSASSRQDVRNPATAETIAVVPLSAADEVDAAVKAGVQAFKEWRETPVVDRIKPLFKLRLLLEENLEELARTITNEAGKTFGESMGEMQRGLENIEVACGTPYMMQGTNNEDIAKGIDEHMIRQPLGVVAAITPFNFPVMVPMWMAPVAIACGNAFILKPSERDPSASLMLAEMWKEAGLPDGVFNVVHGDKEAVDTLLHDPQVASVSFVGSTPIAARTTVAFQSSASHRTVPAL